MKFENCNRSRTYTNRLFRCTFKSIKKLTSSSKKPNSKISYVSSLSNHPQQILKQLPITFNEIFNKFSNNKDYFNYTIYKLYINIYKLSTVRL